MFSTVTTLLQVLGSLGIFIFGMKLMSEAILKLSGEKLRSIMSSMTTNRFAGIFTGFFITCLVQSSSATTVMVVSFVHAQLLNLTQAIGVIMGANLGTTITAWIVTLFGFKFKITAIAVPVIGVGVGLSFMKASRVRNTGNFLTGFGLLFLGLGELKDAVPDVDAYPGLVQGIASLSNYGFLSLLIFIGVGSLLTVLVQSSSAAMAITFTLANQGWLNFEQSAAIILGENIGTTITAFIAAIPANTAAKRAARAHMMFNVLGVLWAVALIGPFSAFVRWLYEVTVGVLPWEQFANQTELTNQLAMFHSTFNLINICLLVGFTPHLARLVTWMVKDRGGKLDKGGFRYLRVVTVGAGELNFEEATRAIRRLGDLSRKMFAEFITVYTNPKQDMGPMVKDLDALEKESNELTAELTEYLIRCASDEVSEGTRQLACSYLRVAAELEEICDCCHRMTDRAARRYRKNRLVTEAAEQDVARFGELVSRFIDFYNTKLSERVSAADMEVTLDLEQTINQKRKELRKRSVGRMMESEQNVKAELIYVDIVNTFERIANHARNIMQSLPKSLA